MSRLIITITLFMFPLISFANNDYIPTSCYEISDQDFLRTCEIARHYQTPIYMTTAALSVAGIEVTSKTCGFKLTERFVEVKNKILQSQKISDVYYLFLYQIREHQKTQNNKFHCENSYKMLGPNSPKGPNGGSNQMFY